MKGKRVIERIYDGNYLIVSASDIKWERIRKIKGVVSTSAFGENANTRHVQCGKRNLDKIADEIEELLEHRYSGVPRLSQQWLDENISKENLEKF